jgi:MSHA biogenesis protein MshN
MSVINQLLVDLEKRRASGAERSVLPDHVRALPDERRPVQWVWIAAGSVACVAALAAAWVLVPRTIGMSRSAAAGAPVAARGTEVAIEKVVAASAGVIAVAKADDAAGAREGPASRLSFELASPPAPAEPEPVGRPPVPASRVIASAPADAPAGEAPAAPAKRVEPAKPATHVASVKEQAAAAAGQPIRKEVHQPTPREIAENEFRKATTLLHQSRYAEAEEGFRAAIAAFPAHQGARQGLVGLLVDARRYGEAERVLQDGLALAPAQLGFAMTLAHLQMDRGDGAQAIATLKKGLDNAQGNAEYVAFLAALLQRQGRHDEAIDQFQAALRAKPAAGVWWLGLGISLQATNHAAEAQAAYSRARSTNSLSPELAAFAEQRIRQLQ